MNRLDSNKNACEVALTTCQQNGAAADQAFAAKAVQLGLTDAEYQMFKADGSFFRSRFASAAAADVQAAKLAAKVPVPAVLAKPAANIPENIPQAPPAAKAP